MKKINFLQSRLLGSTLLLLALLSVTISCKKSSDDPNINEVYIKNMAFTPSTLTVSLNTTVTWTNKDGAAHTVTSTSGPLDSGTIDNNGTYSYTFNAVGSYSYHCTLHPSMQGVVVVNTSTSGGDGY